MLDANHLVTYGVLAQLVLTLAHSLVRSPRRQAQLDAIEQKVEGVLSQLSGVATNDAASAQAGKDGN